MKKIFYSIVALMLCGSPQAQNFHKISRVGISHRFVETPDSINTSDLQQKRLTIGAGFNGDFAVVAYFHTNNRYGHDKSSYYPEGNYFSVNAYKRDSIFPIESVEDVVFPNEDFITLCKKYGIFDVDFFKRTLNETFWKNYWEKVSKNNKSSLQFTL